MDNIELELENLKNTLKEINDQLKSCKEAQMMKEAEKQLADLGIVLTIGIKNKATGEMKFYGCDVVALVQPEQIEIAKGKFITIKFDTTKQH